jgi:L-alanine-DL-glutamate epimerase-like enolase superfamily enzyme
MPLSNAWPGQTMRRVEAPVDRVDAAAYVVPTDAPESDGTLEWDHTTLVVVHVSGGGCTGMGYTYAHASAAVLARTLLADAVAGISALDVPAGWIAMTRAVRNLGRRGIAATAIAAVDMALWDLKARLLSVPLVGLIGGVREAIPLYGSGGFTSYTDSQLQVQLGGWAAEGLPAVKMKIGRDAAADRRRVALAREAIGPDTELFVDANGAYDRKRALAQAEAFADARVAWFEEPVTSDDLDGLTLLRDRAPAGMEIAAGEYGYEIGYFREMAARGAVDVLQADATRCGVTGFLAAGVVCDAWHLPLSAHTAPSVHAHLCCAVPRARHLEYFHDHVRIEQMLFDGACQPSAGTLAPDRSRPGLGIALKRADADRFAL